MRRAGIIPHEWIVEAKRQTMEPGTWSSVHEMLSAHATAFRRSLWDESDVHVEIWSEAATMIGVLWPVCDELDVYLRPTEGSCSETLAWNAAQDINAVGKPTFIYHIGDFDYKGLEILDATKRRVNELASVIVVFTRLAATQHDRDRYIDLAHEIKAPRNNNAGAVTLIRRWMDRYGPMALEVDAIPTGELRTRVRWAIMRHIDQDTIDAVRDQQDVDRNVLSELAEQCDGS
jgi:hypothetical protein